MGRSAIRDSCLWSHRFGRVYREPFDPLEVVDRLEAGGFLAHEVDVLVPASRGGRRRPASRPPSSGDDPESPAGTEAVDGEVAAVGGQDEVGVELLGERDEGAVGVVHRQVGVALDQLAAAA